MPEQTNQNPIEDIELFVKKVQEASKGLDDPERAKLLQSVNEALEKLDRELADLLKADEVRSELNG